LSAILLEHPKKYENFKNGITLKLFTSNKVSWNFKPQIFRLLARQNPKKMLISQLADENSETLLSSHFISNNVS
jgi:hypothetical protein